MYDPYDPTNDPFLYNLGNSANEDPEETFKGCLATGLIILGFMVIVTITYIISKII